MAFGSWYKKIKDGVKSLFGGNKQQTNNNNNQDFKRMTTEWLENERNIGRKPIAEAIRDVTSRNIDTSNIKPVNLMPKI